MTRAAALTIIAVCAFAAGVLGFLAARPHLSMPRAMHRAVHPPTLASASYPEGAIGQCMRMADLRRWKAAEDDCDFAYTQIQVGGIVSALSLSVSPTDAENVAAATAIALALRGEARANLGERVEAQY